MATIPAQVTRAAETRTAGTAPTAAPVATAPTGRRAPTALPPVRFQAPKLPPLDAAGAYFALAEEARWFSNGGPCATLLAERLAAAVGGGVEAVPVASCTAGLLVTLRAVLGEPSGDRRLVALPSFTFVATAAAVRWCGFEPLWVDVDPDGWHLDAHALDAALDTHRGRVAGVVACSTFGTRPPVSRRAGVDEVAAAHGVPVVYDSAAAWGAVDDQGVVAGAAGVAEVFSFHATKPFAAGEGGAVTTRDPELADRIRSLANFGFTADRRVPVVGINAKMSELHAAVALAVLDRYHLTLQERRRRAALVRAGLEPFGWRFQLGAAGSTVQFVPALAPSAEVRDRVLAAAAEAGIELRTYFDPPLHQEAAFAGAAAGPLPVTEELARRVVSLPMADDLLPRDVERVIACCRRAT